MLRRGATLYHAAFLRRLATQAHHDSNLVLQQLTAEHQRARRLLTAAPFRYVALAQGEFPAAGRTIAAPRFHRQYGLCLDAIELRLHGYCVEQRFGWERRTENTFATRAPLRWRSPPLLALTLRVCHGATTIDWSVAGAGATATRAALVVRLDDELSNELALLHHAASLWVHNPGVLARLLTWLRRHLPGVRNRHAAENQAP